MCQRGTRQAVPGSIIDDYGVARHEPAVGRAGRTVLSVGRNDDAFRPCTRGLGCEVHHIPTPGGHRERHTARIVSQHVRRAVIRGRYHDANGDITRLSRRVGIFAAVAWGINADVQILPYVTASPISIAGHKLDLHVTTTAPASAPLGALQSRAVECPPGQMETSISACIGGQGPSVMARRNEEAVITGIASDTSEVSDHPVSRRAEPPACSGRWVNVNLERSSRMCLSADIFFTVSWEADSRQGAAAREFIVDARRCQLVGRHEGLYRARLQAHLHVAHPPVHEARGRGPGSSRRTPRARAPTTRLRKLLSAEIAAKCCAAAPMTRRRKCRQSSRWLPASARAALGALATRRTARRCRGVARAGRRRLRRDAGVLRGQMTSRVAPLR